MRNLSSITCVLLLVLAVPAAATDLEQAIQKGPIFASLGASIRGAGMGDAPVVVGTPIAYESGVALYELTDPASEATQFALVSVSSDPLAGDREEAAPAVDNTKVTPAPSNLTQTETGSCRCVINAYKHSNFGTLLLITNIDFNDIGRLSGHNDQYSSLKTTCNPAWFFQNHTFTGSFLYVNANVSISNLGTFGFNDKISSILHDLP